MCAALRDPSVGNSTSKLRPSMMCARHARGAAVDARSRAGAIQETRRRARARVRAARSRPRSSSHAVRRTTQKNDTRIAALERSRSRASDSLDLRDCETCGRALSAPYDPAMALADLSAQARSIPRASRSFVARVDASLAAMSEAQIVRATAHAPYCEPATGILWRIHVGDTTTPTTMVRIVTPPVRDAACAMLVREHY